MIPIFRAYPRHSVDISAREYFNIFSNLCTYGLAGRGKVIGLENSFAEYIRVPQAVAIPSARLGLYLTLRYYNFPLGTEVIMTPFTHWSIFTVIKACGLKPVFVDIDKDTYNTEPDAVKARITLKTRLIILTHMWGQPCKMDDFISIKKECGIKIIEDCAMATGASYNGRRVGSFGDASIFSFGKAKAINAFGGGMLCTLDPEMARFAREETASFSDEAKLSLGVTIASSIAANILTRPGVFFFSFYPLMRILNLRDPYNPIEHKKDVNMNDGVPQGWKVKLANIQALIGLNQLKDLDKRNTVRINNANMLNDLLQTVSGVRVPRCQDITKHIYLYYSLYINKQIDLNVIRKFLINDRVDSQLSELTGAKELAVFGENPDNYPIFKDVSSRLLIIPNGIYLNKEDVYFIASRIKKVLEKLD